MQLDFQTVDGLRKTHPGWRLLNADSAPLVISFLYGSFIKPNVRTFALSELVSKMEDHLFELRNVYGGNAFPRSAAQYIEEWASDDKGWLRKYYTSGSDEPQLDLTPAVEKAIDWILSLSHRPFVTTESRLLSVFELLRELVGGTQADPEARIADLESRKREIEVELQKAREGRFDLMDDTQIRERFLHMSSVARGLLSDFREVEHNFRELDRQLRERIATWEGTKAELLDEVFHEHDAIEGSDQGRSFRAFWDFLMSPSRQEELSRNLDTVFALPAVRGLDPDPRLRRIHFDWQEAGEVAQRTVARLSEQLRRFLDEQTWLENKRILEIIRKIEHLALDLRASPPEGKPFEIDDLAPTVHLPIDLPLHRPTLKTKITVGALAEGEQGIPPDALFNQLYIDKSELLRNIRKALKSEPRISLGKLLERYPLRFGLAELVTYVSIASREQMASFDEGSTETVSWVDAQGVSRRAELPLVIFHSHNARTA